MTVPTDKTYPTNATNKTWQAKKTTGDKMLTKTGLGDRLTEAEKKWKAIAWDHLDLAKQTIGNEEQARAALRQAQTAQAGVEAAKTAVTKAYDEARVTAATKGLSSGTKTAANNAVTALQQANQRLDTVTIKEFEDKAKQMAAPAKLTDVSVVSGGKEVATADQGLWNSHTKELSLTRVTWKVDQKTIDTYKTAKMVVRATSAAGTKDVTDFTNDMQLLSSTGNAAKFKGLH